MAAHPQRLNSVADMLEAIGWCLAGIPKSDIADVASLLWPHLADFEAVNPSVALVLADLRYPGNRKSAWSMACAILASDAKETGDETTFWRAGFEVLQAYRQSKRGNHSNRKTVAQDALDALIRTYLKDFPHTSGVMLFDQFSRDAGPWHEVLIEFDTDREELVCQLDPASERLSNVGRKEFARRYRHATGCM